MQFYTKITTVGLAKLAAYLAGGSAITINEFAIGDANGSYYEPSVSQVALVHEVYRDSPTSKITDPSNPNYMVISLTIPSAIEAEFYGREAGLFDADGDLFAIAKIPLFHKVPASSGAATPIVIKLILDIQNSASVTVVVDESTVYATAEQLEALADAVVNLEHNDIAGRDAEDAHPASSISVIASDYLQSVDVNSALIELAQKIRSYGGVRQTVLDGLKDANGFPDFINKPTIKSLLHFNNNLTDEVGNTWLITVGSTSYITGIFGNALWFNGLQLETPAATFSDIFTGTQDFTLKIRVKHNIGIDNYFLFGQGNAGAANGFSITRESGTGKINFWINGSIVINGGIISDTNNHEICAERYAGVLYQYIDGVLVGTYSGGASITPTANPFTLGGMYNTTTVPKYNGAIDEFVVYQEAIYKGASYTPATSEIAYQGSLVATIKASATDPFIVTAADGYSDKGAVDYVGAFLSDQNIMLTANATNYLYAEYNKVAKTWGLEATILSPTYARTNGYAQINTPMANTISSSANSGYPAANAFDGNTSTFWGSAITDAAAVGNVYIGQSGLAQKVNRIILNQYAADNNHYASSIKVQWSSNGTTWTDIQTFSGLTIGINTIDITNSYTPSGVYYLRLLQNNQLGVGQGWDVLELNFYTNESWNFDIAKMKVGSGSPRVYFAEAVAGASSVTSVTPYAYKGLYFSGDFTTTATGWSKPHNIGVNDVEAFLKENGSQKAKDITLTNKTATWTAAAATSNLIVKRSW